MPFTNTFFTSQASINETVGLKQFADAVALQIRPPDCRSWRSRGVDLSSVVNLYYSVSASETKQRLLAEALGEAESSRM